MNRFAEYPFVRVLIPFIIGIISYVYIFPSSSLFPILFFALLIAYLFDIFVFKIFEHYKFRLINGIYLSLLFFLAGIYWTSIFDDSHLKVHFQNYLGESSELIVDVIDDPQEKENSIKLKVNVAAIKVNDNWIKTKGKLWLYLKKGKSAYEINYGDKLIVSTKLNEIFSPKNPNEFNYKQYCFFNQIYFQGYAVDEQWKKIDHEGNALLDFASRSRKKLLATLASCDLENQEYAVAAALILGYTDEINAETKTAYSSSGALHVLAVSGLHVAIIYTVIDKLLFFLLFFKRGIYWKALIILILLWIYALLTGLSPSVVRAATMLSFVVIAKTINRNANIYNTIASSAFVLLCFNPFLLMEVGFQLSYLAVIGIIYLQPRIYQWFYFRNKILDFVWGITAVSLAAQIATFPLGILYFHQFPNYFMISNLIVIPLGTVILYVGILTLIFSNIIYLGDFLAFLLKYLVQILNTCVIWVEQLPYSLTTGFAISIFESYLIYAIIISSVIYFSLRKLIFLKVTFLLVTILFIGFSYEKIGQIQQQKIIVYSVKNHSAIDLVYGNENIFISDSLLQSDEQKMLFHIRHNWDAMGISNTRQANSINEISKDSRLFSYHHFLAFNDFRIFVVDSKFSLRPSHSKIRLDMILIQDNFKINYDQLKKLFDFNRVVFDSSNKKYSVEKFRKSAPKDVEIVDVNETGAFIKEI